MPSSTDRSQMDGIMIALICIGFVGWAQCQMKRVRAEARRQGANRAAHNWADLYTETTKEKGHA
jgi:hypothetical protein